MVEICFEELEKVGFRKYSVQSGYWQYFSYANILQGMYFFWVLEPVCCKNQQKKVPDQILVCGIGFLWRTWMIPNWLYMSPSRPKSKWFPWSPRINFIPFRIFRGPLFFFKQTGSRVESLSWDIWRQQKTRLKLINL